MMFIKILGGEFLKLRRCAIVWATLAAWLFMGSIAGLFLWIVSNPGVAASLGLIGQKAQFAAGDLSADWAGLQAMVGQMAGLGGMIMYSVIVAWIFGREYAEGTAKNMLGLPLPRAWFTAAKLAVSAVWMLALTLAVLVETLAVGAALGLPGFSLTGFLSWSAWVLSVTALAFALGPAVAFVAVAGKGYMAPMGYTMLSLVVGTVLGATDWARWCPWSIVPLYSGAAGPRADEIGAGSVAVMCLFFAAGLAATALREAWADNAQ